VCVCVHVSDGMCMRVWKLDEYPQVGCSNWPIELKNSRNGGMFIYDLTVRGALTCCRCILLLHTRCRLAHSA